MNYAKFSAEKHLQHQGKWQISSKFPLENTDDLSIAYSPGVAEPCKIIAEDKEKSFSYTCRGNTVAVITDGTAVLGLGDIGPEAAMPVMEGKCLLFKRFGGVDAVPLCLATTDVDEIVETVVRLAPSFGGINLEDIAAPRCFEIEKKLIDRLDIPVFHDDQHGTAIVVLAALKNSLKVVNKKIEEVKIVMSGAGAAGIAIAKLIMLAGGKNIILCDSKGVIGSHRDNLSDAKKEVLQNSSIDEKGSLKDVLENADVFLGVSKGDVLVSSDIKTMSEDAIVFAMANPTPEIFPVDAKKGGAKIIATGRSDFPNQVNNVVAFPGLFKGLFAMRAKKITPEMYMAVANALANSIKNPSEENILPNVFDEGVAERVAEAVQKCV